MTIVLLIAKIIQGYQGYKQECRKEDDLLVKQKIIEELTSLRSMLTQFTNEKENSTSLNKEVKPVKNNIDEFIQEIEYSLSGHTYPFFSSQCSVGSHQLKQLRKMDLSLLNKTNDLITYFEEMQQQDYNQNELVQFLRRFNQKISNLRSEFKQRTTSIKKIN